MSYFGLNPVNQNQQLDEAASNPVGFNSDVGFFDNAVCTPGWWQSQISCYGQGWIK